MDYVNTLIKAKANPLLFGGKGANLIRLINFGFNVPSGFIVNTNAYKKFLKDSDLNNEILHLLSQNYKSNDVLELSNNIKNLFLKSNIPYEVVNEIRTIFNKSHDLYGEQTSFSVRSSANIEDSSKFSFAGQAESFLNKVKFEEILEGIKGCWISLYSPNALLYILQMRKNHKEFSLIDLDMAVIVQKMLKSQISGVLFTVNIINNNRNEMFINSTWGLGDTITNNLIIPDMIILKKKKFSVTKCVIGEKEKTSISNPEGSSTILIPTEQALKEKCSLNKSQLGKLHNLGLMVETCFGFPQDIEWAIENNIIFVLQSRPITTLREKD
ncbi:MAG: PEP/pyruvate-binding domain-containing protein [Promethearchaeota archaeon]